eukprot:6477760-Amphidinium_carterae.1
MRWWGPVRLSGHVGHASSSVPSLSRNSSTMPERVGVLPHVLPPFPLTALPALASSALHPVPPQKPTPRRSPHRRDSWEDPPDASGREPRVLRLLGLPLKNPHPHR